jgi:hypothetical protein
MRKEMWKNAYRAFRKMLHYCSYQETLAWIKFYDQKAAYCIVRTGKGVN